MQVLDVSVRIPGWTSDFEPSGNNDSIIEHNDSLKEAAENPENAEQLTPIDLDVREDTSVNLVTAGQASMVETNANDLISNERIDEQLDSDVFRSLNEIDELDSGDELLLNRKSICESEGRGVKIAKISKATTSEINVPAEEMVARREITQRQTKIAVVKKVKKGLNAKLQKKEYEEAVNKSLLTIELTKPKPKNVALKTRAMCSKSKLNQPFINIIYIYLN